MSPSATSLVVKTPSFFQPGAGLVFPPAWRSSGPSLGPRQSVWLPAEARPRSSHAFYFINLPFALLQGKTHSPVFRPAVGKRCLGAGGTQLPQHGKHLQALIPGLSKPGTGRGSLLYLGGDGALPALALCWSLSLCLVSRALCGPGQGGAERSGEEDAFLEDKPPLAG